METFVSECMSVKDVKVVSCKKVILRGFSSVVYSLQRHYIVWSTKRRHFGNNVLFNFFYSKDLHVKKNVP